LRPTNTTRVRSPAEAPIGRAMMRGVATHASAHGQLERCDVRHDEQRHAVERDHRRAERRQRVGHQHDEHQRAREDQRRPAGSGPSAIGSRFEDARIVPGALFESGREARWIVQDQMIEPRNSSLTVQNSPALRVLVVDDEFLIRWSVAQTLADCGCHVVEASDARGAWQAVRDASRTFDVALLDYRLPDAEGLSLVAAIRARTPRTQVILMTAFGTPEVVRGALDLGAYRVLGKPFEMDEVAELVAAAATARGAADR